MGIERRRAPRIRASLEFQVVGLERRPAMRRGDLSVTGVRIERLGVDVGEVGSIHMLRIATRDREHAVTVPARVVRVFRAPDEQQDAGVGDVAFDLQPADATQREAVAMLFVHVARSQIRYDTDGVRPASEPPGVRRQGGIRSVTVETEWQLRKGEAIKIEVPTREGGTVRLSGQALRSRPTTKGTFRTVFEVHKERNTFVGPSPEPARHFLGSLSRVRAPSLLSLAAMERMSAVLVAQRDDRVVTIYIRDGQIVDADETGSNASRRKLIGEVCQWEEGEFEMRVQPVDRPDGIGVPTSVLLLQLARFYDEQRRVA